MHQTGKTGWIPSHCSSHECNNAGSPCDVSPDGLRMASRCAFCLRSTVCCLSQEAVALRLRAQSNFLARADSVSPEAPALPQRDELQHIGSWTCAMPGRSIAGTPFASPVTSPAAAVNGRPCCTGHMTVASCTSIQTGAPHDRYGLLSVRASIDLSKVLVDSKPKW